MKVVLTLIVLVMAWWWGSELPDMIKYRYSYTDHRIAISGEKPEDMRISARVTVLYDDDSCRTKNLEGGTNQPRKTDYIDASESEGGTRYEIVIPVGIENGNCDPHFATVAIYGQNKIYDMYLMVLGTRNLSKDPLIPLKTDDQMVATCGRTMFVRKSGYKFLSSPDCSLELNGQQIVAKYDYDDPNETNYIPVPQENLNTTTRLTLDVKKDQYYQSERDHPPKVPDGVSYSNYYKSERRL